VAFQAVTIARNCRTASDGPKNRLSRRYHIKTTGDYALTSTREHGLRPVYCRIRAGGKITLVIEQARTGTGRRLPAGSGPVVGDRSGQALAGGFLQALAGQDRAVGKAKGC